MSWSGRPIAPDREPFQAELTDRPAHIAGPIPRINRGFQSCERGCRIWSNVTVMVVAYLALATGKPVAVTGLFLVSGLAVGSLYALGGIGLVILYRATGVLNLASGAVGASGVMLAWQFQQWGWAEPVTVADRNSHVHSTVPELWALHCPGPCLARPCRERRWQPSASH